MTRPAPRPKAAESKDAGAAVNDVLLLAEALARRAAEEKAKAALLAEARRLNPKPDQLQSIAEVEEEARTPKEVLESERKALNLIRRASVYDVGRDFYSRSRAIIRANPNLFVGVPSLSRLPAEVCLFLVGRVAAADLYEDPDDRLRAVSVHTIIATRDGTLALCVEDGQITQTGGMMPMARHVALVCDPRDGIDPENVELYWFVWLALDHAAKAVTAERAMGLSITRRLERLRKLGVVMSAPVVHRLAPSIEAQEEQVDAIVRASSHLTIRFDVREHLRLLVRRLPWPLDPKETARWRRRGYYINDGGNMDATAVGVLVARGHAPPHAGEAILCKWVVVRSHIKGPAGALYIPSELTPATVGEA